MRPHRRQPNRLLCPWDSPGKNTGVSCHSLLLPLKIRASYQNLLLYSSTFGEGNGTPLQYSCLENPMDRGAWWAAVHGVTTEQLHFHFSLSCIGEGNSNPLQCSCLENPRNRRTWWAAVYGVAQSRTRLKRLSSSSSSSSIFQEEDSSVFNLKKIKSC